MKNVYTLITAAAVAAVIAAPVVANQLPLNNTVVVGAEGDVLTVGGTTPPLEVLKPTINPLAIAAGGLAAFAFGRGSSSTTTTTP